MLKADSTSIRVSVFIHLNLRWPTTKTLSSSTYGLRHACELIFLEFWDTSLYA